LKTTMPNILKAVREGKNNPQIRKIALDIIGKRRVNPKNYKGVIMAVADWVHSNIRFVHDPENTDIMYYPLKTIKMGFGDCEDQCITTQSLLGSLGFPGKAKIVSKTGKMWDHIYSLIGYPPDNPTNWVVVDTTIYPPYGREIPYVYSKIIPTYTAVHLSGAGDTIVDALERTIAPKIREEVNKELGVRENSTISYLAQKLGSVTGRKMDYEAFVIPQDAINAFAIPGGSIYVYQGLLDKFSKDVVSGVLGHEIAHIARRHCINNYIARYGIDFISSLIGGRNYKKMAKDILSLIALGYSREAEFEADRYSIYYNKDAHLYPLGIKKFLEWLVMVEKTPTSEFGRKVAEYLRSHPYADERLERVNQEIEKLGLKEEKVRYNKYLIPLGIGGVLFGGGIYYLIKGG